MAARLSSLVDEKTGKIKRLETPMERFTGSILPEALQYATLGIKAFLVSPILAPLAMAAAALWSREHRKQWDSNAQDVTERGEFYHLDREDDLKAFAKKYGGNGVDYAARFLKITADAGVTPVPVLFVNNIENDPAFYNASADNILTDGSKPSIHIGRGVFDKLTLDELTVVTAHEMVHLRQKDSVSNFRRNDHRTSTHAASLLLIGAALLGPLPVLPVLLAVGTFTLLDHSMRSLQQKHFEKIADRGASILTGDGIKVRSVLEKMAKFPQAAPQENQQPLPLLQRLENDFKILPERPDIFLRRIAAHIAQPANQWIRRFAPEKLVHFIYASHPLHETRIDRVRKFEAAHPLWCETRKKSLKDDFNNASLAKLPRRNTYRPGHAPGGSNNIT